MALKDAIALIKNSLRATFDHQPYDPKPGQARVINILDTAAKQHNEGKTKSPKRSWDVGFDSIAFTLKLNANTISLPDPETGEPEATSYIAPKDFQSFLKLLKDAVKDGELDTEIQEAMENPQGNQATGSETTRVTRKRARAGTGSKSTNKPHPDPAHPSYHRSDWQNLDRSEKGTVSANFRYGMNADRSLISEVGHKYDVPVVKKP